MNKLPPPPPKAAGPRISFVQHNENRTDLLNNHTLWLPADDDIADAYIEPEVKEPTKKERAQKRRLKAKLNEIERQKNFERLSRKVKRGLERVRQSASEGKVTNLEEICDLQKSYDEFCKLIATRTSRKH